MCGFRNYFTPLTGVLFTSFARATCSLSVAEEYLALEGGPSGFRPGFTCPILLGNLFGRVLSFVYGAITLYGFLSSVIRLDLTFVTAAGLQKGRAQAPQPPVHNASGLACTRFGLCPLRSPLLRTSMFLSLPGVTKMFQFAPFASADYSFIGRIMRIDPHGVPAFGDLRIKGCLHLPGAYRSWPRPSSPLSAKASTTHPF